MAATASAVSPTAGLGAALLRASLGAMRTRAPLLRASAVAPTAPLASRFSSAAVPQLPAAQQRRSMSSAPAAAAAGAPQVELPKRARVVVIGGGIIGTSAAYHLAKLGWGAGDQVTAIASQDQSILLFLLLCILAPIAFSRP